MISKESIDRIFDAVRIEEVVGDFVQLKKRGVNLIGLCPFHNEKTPSFNVNSVRNIYKCFGCGKGGNAVNFIMEHEHFTYPEALRYLAGKYQIEIEETEPDPKELQLQDEKESLFALNEFARKTFSEQLFDAEEGRAIGLTYFHERGFSDDTIRKFGLGYSLNEWSAFTDHAVRSGYKQEFLEKTGLTVRNEAGKTYDRFRGRVMFPIHNLSGRVIGFGGRVLKKDEKTAKYVNSPESDIYHKSKSLYGIFFAKKAIVQRDNCFLVEGYTDVISLHQAGIENVAASSGTSLTTEQIRLIARYTKNITVLYDGDAAGIKASLRGIDLILEEGLNVKVVLFPDGDDPDSFSKKHSGSEVAAFIDEHAQDFVVFKTNLLLQDVQNDPVRKAGLIRDVVETVAKIPDQIVRSMYIQRCSSMMEIEEGVLVSEMNKILRQKGKRELPQTDLTEVMQEVIRPVQPMPAETTEFQEQNIIRILLNYSDSELHFSEETESADEPGKKELRDFTLKVAEYIVHEIEMDELSFEHPVYDKILKIYQRLIPQSGIPDTQLFLNSEEPEVSEVSVELLSPRYFLSENWETIHKIFVPREEMFLRDTAEKAIFHLKNKKVMKMLEENQRKLKEAHQQGADYTELLERHQQLENIKMEISRVLGIDILK